MRKTFYPLIFACLVMTGCASDRKDSTATPQAPGMANPASVYCAQQGGKSIPVTTAKGQSADCLLPNGRRVDEWKLYRSAHKQSQSPPPQ
ncbi:putative hemolysin [Labrys neptuniae]